MENFLFYTENMENTSLEKNLNWELLQIAMRAKRSLTVIAESYDLTISQWYSLCSMEENKPVPMNFFAGLLTCDASTVTSIVDSLSDAKLIAREENTHDRRYKMIALTKKGALLRERILQDLQSYESSTLEPLTAAQKEQLQSLAEIILA